jgi:hypothetical protein
MSNDSIEWLVNQLYAKHMLTVNDEDISRYQRIVKRAKEMRDQEIKEACKN